MNPLPVGDFLELLRLSNLLEVGQFAAFKQEIAETEAAGPAPQRRAGVSSRELAGKLIERGWLTRWQADTLLSGHKTFFFGKYRLLERIGTGGMGSVYKARHDRLGRTVALKIMSRAVVKDARAVARFRNEIRAVAALDHPHIVAAYDADCVDTTHFLVMEFVPGHDLGWYVQTLGKLPIGWACECIRQAALGLQHAHDQGMVHRDIKPTNLLIAEYPETGAPLLKLLDLGLARFADEAELPALTSSPPRRTDAGLTQAGQVLGTPDYMSPEQSLDTRHADIRSDIFSLGCTLFRLLSAEMPFAGENVAQKLKARQLGHARDLRALRPDLPAELEAVIAKMMARDPGDRYQTAREVALALAPFAVASPLSPARPARSPAPLVESQPSAGPLPKDGAELDQFFAHLATHPADEPSSPAPRSFLRNALTRVPGRIWVFAGSAVAALLVLFGLWRWLSESVLIVEIPASERRGVVLTINEQPRPLSDSETLSVAGRPGRWTLKLSRPGFVSIHETFSMGAGEYRQWSPVWKPTEKTQRSTHLAVLRKRADVEEKSDPAADSLAALRSELVAFRAQSVGTEEAAAAAQLLARLPSPLDSLSLPTSSVQTIPGSGNRLPVPAEMVAVLGDGRLKFWNRVQSISVGPGGNLVAAAGADGTLRIFDREAGHERHVLRVRADLQQVAFGRADDVLAVVEADRDVTLFNGTTGSLRATLENARAPLAFSPDGRWLATVSNQSGVQIWNVADGRLEKTLAGHGRWATRSIAFAPDGGRLATYGADETAIVWDLAADQPLRRFEKVGQPCFNPDWTVLATGRAGSAAELRSVADGKVIRQLNRGGEPLAFTADGSRLITRWRGTAKEAPRIKVWNLGNGDNFRTVLDVTDAFSISAEGVWLAVADKVARTLRFCDLRSRDETTVACDPLTALAFAPKAATLVTGGENGWLRCWDAGEAREQKVAEPPLATLAFCPSGTSFVARLGERIELHDLTGRRPVSVLEGRGDEIEGLAVSPDGGGIVGYGGRGLERMSVRWWNAGTGHELPQVAEQPGSVRVLAFTADGKKMATAGDSPLVFLWNVADRQIVESLDKLGPAAALALDPQGSWLAAGRERSIHLYDAKTTKRRELEFPKDAKDITFHQLEAGPNGARLAAVTSAGLFVWNVQTGQRQKLTVSGDGKPQSAAFSLAGDRLAVSGDTGKIWIWRTESGQLPAEQPAEELSIGPPGGIIRKVVWSPDGRHLLTHNGNGTVCVLRLTARTAAP